MKPLLPLIGLTALLSACGTGLIPPITQNLSDINATLPTAAGSTVMVVYPKDNQFSSLPAIAGSVNSVEIAGNLLYTGTGNLSSLGVYVRQDTVGCTDGGTVFVCTDDESANKLEDISITKGQPVATVLSGTPLNMAVQKRTGFIGFRINSGNSVQGDKVSVTDVKATIRF